MYHTQHAMAAAIAFAFAATVACGAEESTTPAATTPVAGAPMVTDPLATAAAPTPSNEPVAATATPKLPTSAPAAAAASGEQPKTGEAAAPSPLDFLDAVRAQRESLIARERQAASDRSSAMRKQMDQERAWVEQQARARRWLYDPQGAYLSELSHQRTEAMKAQSQAFRDQAQQQADAMRQQMDQMRDAQERWMIQSTPPYGWNNPWYYRGF
jgi:ElaB/YqjD/DUF883 family membrane-anchored ribosome-binding protein